MKCGIAAPQCRNKLQQSQHCEEQCRDEVNGGPRRVRLTDWANFFTLRKQVKSPSRKDDAECIEEPSALIMEDRYTFQLIGDPWKFMVSSCYLRDDDYSDSFATAYVPLCPEANFALAKRRLQNI